MHSACGRLSLAFARQLPQRGSRGTSPHNANHPPAGCFVSGRVIFGVLCGGDFFHSTGCLRNRGGAGDFHRPYESSECLTAPIHRGTLPQGGSRGGLAPFNGVLAKIRGYGRFSSPLRNSEVGTFHHSSKYAGAITNRSRGFFWLGWGGGVCGWLCFQSGGSVPGLRRKSGPLLPGCGCGRRTYRSASAARRPPAR